MAEVVNPIVVEVDGIKFTSAFWYYDGNAREIAHGLKENNREAIAEAAAKLCPLISPCSVIVPIPNRCGYARETLELAKELSRLSGIPIANVLKGNMRESIYEMKAQGKTLTEKEMGLRQTASLPFYRTPVLLDNVAATGQTAIAAYNAIGRRGEVLTYAIDDSIINRGIIIKPSSCNISR